MNPESQENDRQNQYFLQIPLLQISENAKKNNVLRILHGELKTKGLSEHSLSPFILMVAPRVTSIRFSAGILVVSRAILTLGNWVLGPA